MEIRVGKKVFEEALNTVKPLIKKRITLPIMSHILIDAHNKVTISASDLETYIRYDLPATVIEEGRVLLPFDVLIDSAKFANKRFNHCGGTKKSWSLISENGKVLSF